MVQDTIETIKQAEEQAAQKIQEAAENGRQIVEQAKRQAEQWKEEAAGELKAKAADLDSFMNQKGESYLVQAEKGAQEEIAILKENAYKKTDEVVNQIISKLV